MAVNLMEIIRSYELAPEGTIGIQEVWLCVHHANVILLQTTSCL